MAVISRGSRTGGRLPRGPHRLSPDEVAEDQRQRLIEAMLRLTEERGHANTTVAEIIVLAEVSRKTFYAHFADREELLLAAFDATAPAALDEIRTASHRTGGATRQLEAMLRRLCRASRESPSAIAVSTIEIAAMKPDGLERHDRLVGEYGELIDDCLRGNSSDPALPSTLARAIAGGLHRTIDAHLRLKPSADLAVLVPELTRWIRSYHPVPSGLNIEPSREPPWPCSGTNGYVGGRAPGTLMLAPVGYQPPRGKGSPGFEQHANRERILDAVAQLTTTEGYLSLTAQSITLHADLSERAFLAHFKGKDDAFAAAVEVGHMKGQAIVERARASAPDWPTGVRNAIHAFLEFLASEPYFTRLAFVDAPLAGPAMARRTYEHVSAYARLLLDGAPQRRRPPALAPEATVHGLFEIAFHHAAHDKAVELPRVANEATYLALAPFLGVTEGAEKAT